MEGPSCPGWYRGSHLAIETAQGSWWFLFSEQINQHFPLSNSKVPNHQQLHAHSPPQRERKLPLASLKGFCLACVSKLFCALWPRMSAYHQTILWFFFSPYLLFLDLGFSSSVYWISFCYNFGGFHIGPDHYWNPISFKFCSKKHLDKLRKTNSLSW